MRNLYIVNSPARDSQCELVSLILNQVCVSFYISALATVFVESAYYSDAIRIRQLSFPLMNKTNSVYRLAVQSSHSPCSAIKLIYRIVTLRANSTVLGHPA